MPLGLYTDVHVPSAVTEGLRLRSLDVLTSQEDGTREVDDQALLVRATALGRVLFSQDRDLLRIATQWQRAEQKFPGIIYSPQIDSSIGKLIEDLELLLTCCPTEEIADRVIYLPLQ